MEQDQKTVSFVSVCVCVCVCVCACVPARACVRVASKYGPAERYTEVPGLEYADVH
jgi:hypothetical protein